jgi:hypothetical protein
MEQFILVGWSSLILLEGIRWRHLQCLMSYKVQDCIFCSPSQFLSCLESIQLTGLHQKLLLLSEPPGLDDLQQIRPSPTILAATPRLPWMPLLIVLNVPTPQISASDKCPTVIQSPTQGDYRRCSNPVIMLFEFSLPGQHARFYCTISFHLHV